MPRQARLDAPGVLHHIMIRGIERRKIFIVVFSVESGETIASENGLQLIE